MATAFFSPSQVGDEIFAIARTTPYPRNRASPSITWSSGQYRFAAREAYPDRGEDATLCTWTSRSGQDEFRSDFISDPLPPNGKNHNPRQTKDAAWHYIRQKSVVLSLAWRELCRGQWGEVERREPLFRFKEGVVQ